MSDRTLAEILEEHGLSPDLLDTPRLTRREFLATVGGGIAVLLTAPALRVFAEPAPVGRQTPRPVTRETPHEITGWLYIDQHGVVTAYAGKVELGQNVRTSLALVVAEELHLRPETVKTRLHRARHIVRANLEAQLGPALGSAFPFMGVRCERLQALVVGAIRDPRPPARQAAYHA